MLVAAHMTLVAVNEVAHSIHPHPVDFSMQLEHAKLRASITEKYYPRSAQAEAEACPTTPAISIHPVSSQLLFVAFISG